jgi:small subunit ribosomal protein S17
MLAARRAAAAVAPSRAATSISRTRCVAVRAAAQELQGTVVSAPSGTRTAVVAVERLVVHPTYQKRVRETKKFTCQDDVGVTVGDVVRVKGVRPMSKTKRFAVSEVVRVADK